MRTTPSIQRKLLTALMLWSVGCGDGGESEGETQAFPSDTTCGLAIRTQGAVAVNLGTSSGAACLVQRSSGSGIDVGFFFQSGDLTAAQLLMPTAKQGQTGDLPAVVALLSQGGEWVSEDCLATLTEHELVGAGELGAQNYRVVGSVRCEPAQPDSGDAHGNVSIPSLDFVATVSWGP